MNKIVSITLLALLCSCATVKEGDVVVVNAERTTAVALSVVDTILNIEYSNRQFFISIDPKIKQFCDQLRKNAPSALDTARTLTKAYKTNRTAENKANMTTAIAVLETMLSEASKWLVQMSALQGQASITNK